MTAELRGHEREIASLASRLAALEGDDPGRRAPRPDAMALYLTARMTRHRISIALLVSRLEAPAAH